MVNFYLLLLISHLFQVLSSSKLFFKLHSLYIAQISQCLESSSHQWKKASPTTLKFEIINNLVFLVKIQTLNIVVKLETCVPTIFPGTSFYNSAFSWSSYPNTELKQLPSFHYHVFKNPGLSVPSNPPLINLPSHPCIHEAFKP